ncbi:MAG: hypothetical protein RR891_06115 [Clostridium sp.]
MDERMIESLERIANSLEKINKQLCCFTAEGEFNEPLDKIASELEELNKKK